MVTKKPTKTKDKENTQKTKKTDTIEVEFFGTPEDKNEHPTETGDINDEDTRNGKEKYFESIGRRKNAIARVRLYTRKAADVVKDDKALITVNNKNYTDYFLDQNLQLVVESPLRKLKSMGRFKMTVIVNGGGLSGQAGAVRHGIARALTSFDQNFRKKLKKATFLTRDSRVKERRKYGLKKARKSPQWSKR